MAEKVAKVGVKKEPGYLYFVDKRGNVSRSKMARGGKRKGRKPRPELVKRVGVKKKDGFLYFIDKRGDISCAKMVRRGAKKRKKSKKKGKRRKRR
jgi:hypothetical protein